MSDTLIRSYRFRAEREAQWQDLERLVSHAEASGARALAPGELQRLPVLYRATVSSLSVARAISLDASLLAYLENLATRAYFLVYGTRISPAHAIGRFFSHELPATVRASRHHILASALVMGLGVALGWLLTASDMDWFYTFVDGWITGGRDPSAATAYLRGTLFDAGDWKDELVAFASFLFTHNAAIGILCFALGAAFGIPVVYLLFVNGLTLGAMCALFDSRGLGTEMLGWLAIHGTTELFAIVLCGAAGFLLADGMVRPGRRTRLAALAARGRPAAVLVLGAVAMLLVAALLEGLGRQLVQETWLRFAIGGAMLVLWLVAFTFGGRERRDVPA